MKLFMSKVIAIIVIGLISVVTALATLVMLPYLMLRPHG